MIIKFLSRKSNSGQLLKYILRYVIDEQKLTKKDFALNNSDIQSGKFIIRHNVRARSITGFVREFNENESYRIVHRKDSVKVFHTIISFSNGDKKLINDQILRDIAGKFIEERGVNNLYVGTKHEDKEHIHLHICTSGTQLNGRSARISNQKFHSIKLALDRYQRENYPFLVNSLPEHGKVKRLAKEALIESFKAGRQNNKSVLLERLEEIYSKAVSREDFLSQIKALGHQPYFRGYKLQGVLLEGKVKYRFSRLGFDQERLESVGEGKALLNNLQELTALSQKQPREKEADREKIPQKLLVTDTKDDKIETQLTELASIRDRSRVLDKENEIERTRSLNMESDESETSFVEEGHQPSLFPSGMPSSPLLKLIKQP